MLSELTELQESEEDVWGKPTVSFTIETRTEDGTELVQREYTFSHAPEWEKWTFQEFEEKRTEDTSLITERNWRRSRHIIWSEPEAPTVDVPPEVEKELQELLGLEEMTIQKP
jgi:hypothetical protein